MARRPDLRELAQEIVSRGRPAGSFYVVRVSDPPTSGERLQLMSARLRGLPIAITPAKCQAVEEWVARYACR